MTEKQLDKIELMVKDFLKKKGMSIKESTKKLRKYLLVDWYVGNTPVKFEVVKEIKKYVRFQGINGRTVGWFRRSRARWLALYVEDAKQLYLMSLPGIRRYVREAGKKMKNGYYELDFNILKGVGLVLEEFSLGVGKKDKTTTEKSASKK